MNNNNYDELGFIKGGFIPGDRVIFTGFSFRGFTRGKEYMVLAQRDTELGTLYIELINDDDMWDAVGNSFFELSVK